MSIYKMGQYRFAGKDSCVTQLNSQLVTWPSSAYNCSFIDLAIEYESTFSVGEDYFVRIKLPRDKYHDTTYNIKLVKKENKTEDNEPVQYSDNSEAVVYQWLASEHIEGSLDNKQSSVMVVLFKNPFNADELIAAIPKEIDAIEDTTLVEAYSLYHLKDGTYRYAAANSSEQSIVTEQVMEYRTTILYSDFDNSITSPDDEMINFEIAFRPIENGFSHILIEIERFGDDFNIETPIYTDDGVELLYGRMIDPEQVTYDLYSLVNFVGKEKAIPAKPLTHIGVWGKPGTLMSINGEPIRIGPRGYYEQDSIPINSISVVAESHSKMFTIDYKYETE